jgi:hypothetical protein
MIPAVIGDNSDILSLARAECGGEIHVFAERLRLVTRLKPYVRFHRVSGMSPDIISMYINSFAAENPDFTVLVFDGGTDSIETYIEHSCIIWREGLKK